MANGSLSTRVFSGFLAVLLTAGNVVFAHAAEVNFWKNREKSVQLARLSHVPLWPIKNALTPAPDRSVSRRAGSPDGKIGRLLSALSERHGRVRAVHVAAGAPAGPVVVHVQDVHRNGEAQANIGAAIKKLHDEKLLDAVALEGAFGPVDLAPYARYPDADTARIVADYLLKTHRVTGPVHAALVSSLPVPVLGIDDRAHYDAHVAAVRDSARARTAVGAALGEKRRDLSRRKAEIFPPELREFDGAVNGFHAGTVSLTAHAGLLARDAGAGAPRHLGRFLRAAAIEKSLDFAAVEADRSRLLAALVAKLTPRDNEALIAQAVAYRLGRISHSKFYARLRRLLEKAGISLNRYPAMAAYVDYVLLTDAIDGDALLAEMESLERQRYAALAATPEERELVAESRFFALTEKLAAFGLTAREWARYREMSEKRAAPALAADLAAHEKFYAEANHRDAAMGGHLLREIRERRAGVTVLVAGGFHSEGINALLTRNGVSVISFTPRLSRLGAEDGAAYLSVFSQEKSSLDRLFAGERLFLGDNPAQLGGAPALFALVEEARNPLAAFTGAARVIADLSGRAPDAAYATRDISAGVAAIDGPRGTLTGYFQDGRQIDRLEFSGPRSRRRLAAEDAFILAAQSAAMVTGQWGIGIAALAVFILAHLKNIPADLKRAGVEPANGRAVAAWVAGYLVSLTFSSTVLFAAFGAPAFLVVAAGVPVTPLTAGAAAAWVAGVSLVHARHSLRALAGLDDGLAIAPLMARRGPEWLLRLYRTTEAGFPEYLRTQNPAALVQRLVDHVIANPRALAAAWDLLGSFEKQAPGSSLVVPSETAGLVSADQPIENLADLLRRSLNHPRVAEQIRRPTDISRRGFLRFLGWAASQATLGTAPATMETARTFLMARHDPEILLNGPLARRHLKRFQSAIRITNVLAPEEKARLLEIGDLNQLTRLYAQGELPELARVSSELARYLPGFVYRFSDENPGMAYHDLIQNMPAYRDAVSRLRPRLRQKLSDSATYTSSYLPDLQIEGPIGAYVSHFLTDRALEASLGDYMSDYVQGILESGRLPRESDIERLLHNIEHSAEALEIIRGNLENSMIRSLFHTPEDAIDDLQPEESEREREDAKAEEDAIAWSYHIADVFNVAELIAINGGAITVAESMARFRRGAAAPALVFALVLIILPVGLVSGVVPLWFLGVPAVAGAAAVVARFWAARRARTEAKKNGASVPVWLQTLGRALLRGAEGNLDGDILPVVRFDVGQTVTGAGIRAENLTPAHFETLADDVLARFHENAAAGRYTREESERVRGRIAAWLGRPIKAGDMKLKILVSKEQVDERFLRLLAREKRRRLADPAAAPVELVLDQRDHDDHRTFYDQLARRYGLKLNPRANLLARGSRRLMPGAFREFLNAIPAAELNDSVISFSDAWQLDLRALEGVDEATLSAVRYRSLESLIDEILGHAPVIRAIPFSTLFTVFRTLMTQA